MAASNTVDVDYTEAAWAAGFLDGEGYFGIPKSTSRHPCIEAAQVATVAPLYRLQRLLGGTVREGKAAWHWKLEGAPCVRRAVPVIEPFLCVKREQARVVLYHAMTFHTRGSSTRLDTVTPIARAALAEQLLDLRRAA